ncbi:MAG TPA: DUF2298 domain-containing protein [Candidatus Binatia bacterium]|nr:DUF2298 domain-containing protein [Candidatus Binatia bacterium]
MQSAALHREMPVAAALGVLVAGTVWLLPTLAPLLAWPLLLGLPAWLLIARAVPEMGAPGRLGVAVIAGIELSAILAYLIASIPAIGFGTTAVLCTTGLLAAITWLLLTRPMPGLAPPPRLSFSSSLEALRRRPVPYALAAAAVLVIGGILQFSAWHQEASGWVSGGWNWSDFLVHVSIAQSIRFGNFPPQVPYFSGEPLSYHWFGDFHAAILATAASIDVIPALILSNAVLAGALALVVWELARTLTGHSRVALLAAVLVLIGGGLGWIRLPIDLAQHKGGIVRLLSTTPYDNNFFSPFPYFRIASIFGTGLLDQRPTAYGLPAFAGAVLLAHLSWGKRPAGTVVAGLLAALMTPFQFFAAPILYIVLVAMVVARRGWREPRWLLHAALLFLPAVIAAAFIAGPALRQQSSGAVHLTLGWPDVPPDVGFPGAVFFYVTNLGVPFVLAVWTALRRGTPHRLLLAAWVAAIFAIPNLIVVSSTINDADKFFQFMWLGVAILAAWAMRAWPRWLVALALVVSCASAPLMAVWHLTDTRVALSSDQEAAGRWIEDNTPPGSIFVTDAFINSPVDLAGRLRIDGYAPYVANLGYAPAPRQQDVQSIYCDGAQTAASLMHGYGATYVVNAQGLLQCDGGKPTDFTDSPLFETVYQAGGVTIWRLR